MKLGVLWSLPAILGEAAQEGDKVRQGCAQEEVRDGGDLEMSDVDTALLSYYQTQCSSGMSWSRLRPAQPSPFPLSPPRHIRT